MTKVQEIEKLLKELSAEDLEKVSGVVSDMMEARVTFHDFMRTCVEERFAEGLVCPHCGKKHIVKAGRYGKNKDRQRFQCKDCKKTFCMNTNTIFSHTKLMVSDWLQYAKCMNEQMSLRACAKTVGVGLKTAFYMRHKILSAFQQSIGVDALGGVIEMDETFFAESFKGNHKKHNPDWVAPRDGGKSRKRGKQVQYRGLSHEQLCVSTALDRNGGQVAKPACMGRVTTKALTEIYDGKIRETSTICTDSNSAYKKFAKEMSADLVQIEKGKYKKGVYHINNINSYHNKYKRWFAKFYGVATKYAGNYSYWFNWSERNKSEQKSVRPRNIMYLCMSTPLHITQEMIRKTTPF